MKDQIKSKQKIVKKCNSYNLQKNVEQNMFIIVDCYISLLEKNI